MSVQLNPYLNFADGKTRSAMEFYATVFGGTPSFMTFGEMPQMPGYNESMADLIMHSALDGDNGVHLMAADSWGDASGHGTISLSGDDQTTLRGYWDALADGGEVEMPLEQAPWGDWFGSLKDKFGVPWLVNIAGQPG